MTALDVKVHTLRVCKEFCNDQYQEVEKLIIEAANNRKFTLTYRKYIPDELKWVLVDLGFKVDVQLNGPRTFVTIINW